MSKPMLPSLPRLSAAQIDRIHSVESNEYDLARYLIAGEGGDWAVDCIGVQDDGPSVWQTTDALGMIAGEGCSFEAALLVVFEADSIV